MTENTILDRRLGILLGLAAGDRIGGPIRMALRLAESLVERQKYDPDDVLRRYMDWWKEDAFDTGPTAAQVFEQIAAGTAPAEAVRLAHAAAGGMSAGCNPAHRSPPLAMAPFLTDLEVGQSAKREAALTHFDPLAGEVALATALLCRALCAGMDWRSAREHVADQVCEPVAQTLRHPETLPLHSGGFAVDVLHAATHFVGEYSKFSAALEASIQFAGHSNYSPVLVGAIAGSRFGAASIPPALLSHCSILPRVRDVARKLSESPTTSTE